MRKLQGFSEDKQLPLAASAELQSVPYARLKIDSAGRIVIPADMRAAMMVKPGDTITASVENGVFSITSPEVALARVRVFAEEFKARHPGISLVDDLIADRREEARREAEEADEWRKAHGLPPLE
ncbi:AbrB/MazE/SpoVT family DNA-binding domain-containing protein [Mesorhizobium sp. VNQ89]|uniref:AbrB/MazE/SpoVT family DNA-binding domain-containing protein n=1 Tax=Mesorhizobium quangtriensis TaxID=3157709 RepID=UPI0032B816BC